MNIKFREIFLWWTVCSITLTIPVQGYDPDWWKYLIPEGLKHPLSRVALGIDQAFDEVTSPLRPGIDRMKKELNRIPLVKEGIAILDKDLPVLHGILCATTDKNFTKFLHFSPDHPNEPRLLVPNDMELLKKAKYDGSLPTKIIVHGFLDYIRLSDYWMIKMKNLFLLDGNYNVIIVDWSCGNFFPYNRAIENGKITADETADLLRFLQDEAGVRMKDVHLLGHSLGGQVIAFVGKQVPRVGRISGLDPSGPRFYKATDVPHLTPSDADFVDVIHSDGGYNLIDGLAYPVHTGHVDFFPNGGRDQSGCHSFTPRTIADIGAVKSLWYAPTCDHFRAVEYYMESIKAATEPDRCRFIGVKCKDYKTFEKGGCGGCDEEGNCAVMGYNSDKYLLRNKSTGPNKFFLRTASSTPFCMYEYQVVIELDSVGNKQTSSYLRLELLSSSGKKSRLTLENGYNSSADDQKLSYLAVSKFPLKDIQQATLWWGSARKPRREAEDEPLRQSGIAVKTVKITPLTVASEMEMDGNAKTIILCGESNKLLTRGHYLTVSRSECTVK